MRREGLRTVRVRMAAAAACGFLLFSLACEGRSSQVGEVPLGWDGTPQAREVRSWDRESLESATRWSAEEVPVFELVPDTVESQTGSAQRYARRATFLPDGRVVLFYTADYGTEADTLLLHILDPATGQRTRLAAPREEDGRSLNWVDTQLALHDGDLILMGNNQPALSPRIGAADVWQVDRNGRFIRPPSYTNVRGPFLGVFPDRSLVVMTRSGVTDTTIVYSAMAVFPLEAGEDPAVAQPEEILFTTAIPRDPDSGSEYGMPGAHQPHFAAAVSGDTVWTIPTEKPELFAVHRSGQIVLKVEWETGDRSLPPGIVGSVNAVDRFPAAPGLKVGTDGLIYVERAFLLDGRPVRGLEWLVFTPAGELVARLDVPGRFPGFNIMAFGDGSLVAATRPAETGLRTVQVYRFKN